MGNVWNTPSLNFGRETLGAYMDILSTIIAEIFIAIYFS